MRFAVMADIHGNLPALEAVLDDLRSYAVDGVIVAGDIIGGPYVVETIECIRSLNGWTILGNNEEYFRKYRDGTAPEAWCVNQQWSPLRWVDAQLTEEACDYVLSLPESLTVMGNGNGWSSGVAPLRVVHGSPRSQSELIYPEIQPTAFRQALNDIAEPVMICGHTHIPWQYACNGKFAVNPGSVGFPLSGYVGAQYAIMIWQHGRWQAELRAISYDLDRLRKAFRDSGFLEEGGAFARTLLYTLETGYDVTREFLNYAYGIAAEAGYGDCETVPDDAWERAARTFDWSRYQ